MVDTPDRTLLGHGKEQNLVMARIDLEKIAQSEMRRIPYDFTFMWNPNSKTNEQTQPKSLVMDENRGLEERGADGEPDGWRRSRGTNFQLHNKYIMYDVVIVVNDIGVDTHLKVAKRVNPQNSHHKEKNCHCVWEWMATSLVIISQCIQITNHYPVHLQII